MKDLHSDYADCLEAMKEVTGLSEMDVLGTRLYPTPIYRGMIAESLRELRYSTAEIGSVLHRDHSTVTCMLKKLKSSVGCAGYQDVTSVYNAYQEALKRQRDESYGKVAISQIMDGLERLKRPVVSCQLLCGNDDVMEAIDNLESIINQ